MRLIIWTKIPTWVQIDSPNFFFSPPEIHFAEASVMLGRTEQVCK